jgi:hypothetical protein
MYSEKFSRRRAKVFCVLGAIAGLFLGLLPLAGAGQAAGIVIASGSGNHPDGLPNVGAPPRGSSRGVSAATASSSVPTPLTAPFSSTVALTTTTVSIYSGDVCAAWGRTVGAFASVSVPAGPVLLSYSTYSHNADKPHQEYKYTFEKRVGDSAAAFVLNGVPSPVLYRGALRIEYLPAPVSTRYSYSTYSLVTLEPGDYDLGADWTFASGETEQPRRCHLTVVP